MLRGNRSGFPLWPLDVRPWGRNLWRKGWNLITHPSTPSHTHTVQEWKRKVNLNRNMNIFLGKEKKVWVFIGLDIILVIRNRHALGRIWEAWAYCKAPALKIPRLYFPPVV